MSCLGSVVPRDVLLLLGPDDHQEQPDRQPQPRRADCQDEVPQMSRVLAVVRDRVPSCLVQVLHLGVQEPLLLRWYWMLVLPVVCHVPSQGWPIEDMIPELSTQTIR